MAYRSNDPTEVELGERRTRIRRELDELQERADRLAREITEASRGGILSALGNLLGGTTEDELSRARSDHAALEAEIAGLVQRERDVEAQLANIEAMLADRAAQEEARLDAARAAPGPLGDELRAIAAERALANDRLTAFDSVLGHARRALTVVDELGGIENDARVATSLAATVGKVVYNTAGVLTGGEIHTGDREVIESRRVSHVELACAMIQKFLEGFACLAHTWPAPTPIELATRQLASLSGRAFDVANARTCLEGLERAMIAERDAFAHALAQLDARDRVLVRNT